MRAVWFKRAHSADQAQSLVETALILPFLFLLVFNAVNFGYFFYVALNLATAPREAVEYSVQGFLTPAQLSLPIAGPSTNQNSVSFLGYGNLTNSLKNSSNASMQVCSKILGTTGSGTALTANCTTFGDGATFATLPPDPEAPSFVLHRVDVHYTIQPLIPAQPFGITILPTFSVRRQVCMRAMD